MPKKTTSIQCYYNGAAQMDNFMKKELKMDIETFEKRIDKIYSDRKKENILNRPIMESESDEYYKVFDKYVAKLQKYKRDHYNKYMPLYGYGRQMAKLFKEETSVDAQNINMLMAGCARAYKENLFHENMYNLDEYNKLKWETDINSRKAIKRFSDMLLKNDFKKMEYYNSCVNNGKPVKDITYPTLFDTPLPMKRESTDKDINDLSKQVADWAKSLENIDSKLHRNSKEYEKMKSAVLALDDYRNKQGLSDPQMIGKYLEEIQDASMKYVKAKGVGNQSSVMGQRRMEKALTICESTAEYMDCFASKERIDEIRSFEKDYFDANITNEKGVNNYEKGIDAYLANIEKERQEKARQAEEEKNINQNESYDDDYDYDREY